MSNQRPHTFYSDQQSRGWQQVKPWGTIPSNFSLKRVLIFRWHLYPFPPTKTLTSFPCNSTRKIIPQKSWFLERTRKCQCFPMFFYIFFLSKKKEERWREIKNKHNSAKVNGGNVPPKLLPPKKDLFSCTLALSCTPLVVSYLLLVLLEKNSPCKKVLPPTPFSTIYVIGFWSRIKNPAMVHFLPVLLLCSL